MAEPDKIATYKGASKAEASTDPAATNADGFASLRAKFPVLRNLTKETFTNYTSLLAAYARAVETNNPNGVFRDPYAEALSGEAGKAFMAFFPGVLEDPEATGHGMLRDRIMDDEIEDHLNPDVAQLVILGAGMDSRCFRLKNLANCHAFELDSSQELTEYKQQVLQGLGAKPVTKAYDVIVTDLAEYKWPEEMEARGFDRKVPTLWILEGLLMHLTPAGVTQLLSTIDKLSAPGSQMLVDMVGEGAMQMDVTVDEDREMTWSLDTKQNKYQGGVLHSLPWQIEMLMHRDAQGQYSGRAWDPVKFAIHVIPPTMMRWGPHFVASCTKPNAAP